MKKSTVDQKQESKELEAEMARQAGRAQQRTRSRAGLREGGTARAIILGAIPPRIFLTHTPETLLCLLPWSYDNPGGNQESQPERPNNPCPHSRPSTQRNEHVICKLPARAAVSPARPKLQPTRWDTRNLNAATCVEVSPLQPRIQGSPEGEEAKRELQDMSSLRLAPYPTGLLFPTPAGT